MADAHLSVTFAGPFVTYQDAGRPGHMRYGVPTSGPMDRLAFDAAHGALGNDADQTGVEVSSGGLMLHCTQGHVTIAITGGDFVVEHANGKTASWTILTISKGERLAIRAGRSGSWAYIAFAGQVDAPTWLGSHATHATSGFGGGALRTGDTITVHNAKTREDRLGEIAHPDFVAKGPIRVVTGPQEQHFAADAVDLFLSEPYAVSDAYDRMGMRLRGPTLALDGALSIPSEPVVRGSVQVSGDEVPTVLLADHQTTGGYPKIATVIACDIDRLTQLRSGDSLRFVAITPAQAITEARNFAAHKRDYIAAISTARGTLSQRLMRENLIHGADIDGAAPQ